MFYALSASDASLARIVYEVNRQLQATLPVSHFVAASMLRMSADGRRADVWVGGTPDVLVLDPGGRVRQRIASTSLPLGIDAIDRDAISHVGVDLQPGDKLVLCSDGLLEAENSKGEVFGHDRLLAALAAATTNQRLDSVKQALAQHLLGTSPHDDVSLMIVSCKPAA